MLRILAVTAASLFVVFLCLLTVKFWGRSQVYTDYNHPMWAQAQTPLVFVKPGADGLEPAFAGSENLYLDVAVTADFILVVPKEKLPQPVRSYKFSEIRDKVVSVSEKSTAFAPPRKFIFNILENPRAMHEIFLEHMEKIGIGKGENFIVMGEYEAPIKAMKEKAPALLYGPTKPEILKIISMQSMYILEASTIRADAIIHPLTIKNQNFFNEELRAEAARRFKRLIVGPVEESELEQARALNPYGIILSR